MGEGVWDQIAGSEGGQALSRSCWSPAGPCSLLSRAPSSPDYLFFLKWQVLCVQAAVCLRESGGEQEREIWGSQRWGESSDGKLHVLFQKCTSRGSQPGAALSLTMQIHLPAVPLLCRHLLLNDIY